MTTIDWRRCTDLRCPCHSPENTGPRWTWTRERLIESGMAGAARSAKRSAHSSAEEQDLWDAIDGRMRAEMVGNLIHGCPWRIAREVFEVAVADATEGAVPAERDLPRVSEPIRVIFGRFDQRGLGRRPDQAA